MGPDPFLFAAEVKLENWILNKAKLGFPKCPDEVKDAVQAIMKKTGRRNPFTDDRPGDKWLALFLKCKPAVAKRNAEIISKARASD